MVGIVKKMKRETKKKKESLEMFFSIKQIKMKEMKMMVRDLQIVL